MKKKAVRKAKTVTFPGQMLKKSRLSYTMEPLPATFTLIALLGLIITTVFTVSGRIGVSWGVAFDLVFGAMLIASMLSITPGSSD